MYKDVESCGSSSAELKTAKGLVKARFDFVYGEAPVFSYQLYPRYGCAVCTVQRASLTIAFWRSGTAKKLTTS